MLGLTGKTSQPKSVMKKLLMGVLGTTTLFVAGCGGLAGQSPDPGADGATSVVVVESWRNDDKSLWDDVIVPAFEKAHPEIDLRFEPTKDSEYGAAINSKLQAGTAGDVITCFPFDLSLKQYDRGQLASLNDLPGLTDHFDKTALSAFSTDDGANRYCVPIASVLHGFIYNADLFKQAGVSAPQTMDEFTAALAKLKSAGITPLAMGTVDSWTNGSLAFDNIGPNYWEGEKGRQALIDGSAKFTDQPYLDAMKAVQGWAPYLPKGFTSLSYADSKTLFLQGKAAIFPAGSWEVSQFAGEADFELGAFKPPTVGSTCYVDDHVDMGMGLNAASKNPEGARVFLEWLTTADFASLYTNTVPGFYSLSTNDVTIEQPLAKEFATWTQECQPTIRLMWQYLSRGPKSTGNQLGVETGNVLAGRATPEQAVAAVQANLDSWYKK